MFKNGFYITVIFFSLQFIPCTAQDDDSIENATKELKIRGEIYIRFVLPGNYSVQDISEMLSVTAIKYDTVYAFANENQFNIFLYQKIPFDLLVPPSLDYEPNHMLKNTAANIWQTYPAYQQYLNMMDAWAQNFPGLCRLIDIGEGVGGHKILVLKISDNVQTDESEPEVFFTSTIHGDEPSGFVLMLRFIDYLLTSYGTNSQISYLVDNAEIFINPLANPDGTYFLSDTSVYGAKRFNLNNVDLNRDFPVPEEGSKNFMQPETQRMISFMKEKKITLSANFHDGAEVVNYPWDIWPRLHPDNDWYVRLSEQYADTVHKYAVPGYMDDLNNGITNGYTWYQITGGRQDYVNYYLHGREVTIELTENRFPEGSALEDLWVYNKNALVNYLYNCFTGISGMVADSLTGMPLGAQIFINNHDFDNSRVYSDAETGVFYRLINSGNFSINVSSDGYAAKIFGVNVPETGFVIQDARLNRTDKSLMVLPNPFTEKIRIFVTDTTLSNIKITLTDMAGKIVMNKNFVISPPDVIEIDAGTISNGVYIINVSGESRVWKSKIIKISSSR